MDNYLNTLVNDIARILCIQPTPVVNSMLGIELFLIIVVSSILGTRLFLTKSQIVMINHWTYKHPKLLRYVQSPVWWGLCSFLVGLMIFHLGVIYPGYFARFRNYQVRLQLSTGEMTPLQVGEHKQRLRREQYPWKYITQEECKCQRPLFRAGPFESWGVLAIKPSMTLTEVDWEAMQRVLRGQIAMLGGGIMTLLGLLATLIYSTRQKLGSSDHGQAAFAARSELIYNNTGYWWLPLRLMSRGQREIASLAAAPLTVARPPAKTNIVHTVIIGSSGSGKGAYLGGHLFATSTVPIVYFDYKGEMPAAVLRPRMLRWGFPGERPKGLPSLRFNFIEWALTHQDPDLAAKTLASALLPTSPGKETENQWIKDTAIPILSYGILSGRWQNLAELADEIEYSSFTNLLNAIAVGQGRMFSMGGRNVPQYASNEISNNTTAYLSGRARHIVTGSDFKIEEVFSRGIYIMGQAVSPYEKRVLRLFWSIFWFELLRKSEPMPLCVFIDEGIANGPIPNILEALVTLRDRGISLIQCFQFHSGITSVYGRDLARAVFDGHQTHIWLTKGLADADIKEVSQSLKTYTHIRKTRQESRPELRQLLSEDTLKRHARQEKYWAIIDGVNWTTSGRPVIAALVPINHSHWNWRASNKYYEAEMTRLKYDSHWHSPYKMYLDGIIENLEGSTKTYYQHWIPAYPQEAALHDVKERLVAIKQDNPSILEAHIIATHQQEVEKMEATIQTERKTEVEQVAKVEVKVVEQLLPINIEFFEQTRIQPELISISENTVRYDQIKDLSDEQFLNLTGVKISTFDQMLETLKQDDQEKKDKRGPKPKISLEDQLLVALEYNRENRTYSDISGNYDISERSARRIVKWIEDVLIKHPTLVIPGRNNGNEDI